MSEELKPCPFCGAEGKYFDHTEDGYPDCHEVACINTACTYLMTNQSTKELAHKAWNTRHIPEGYVTREEMLNACEHAVTAAARAWVGNLVDPGDFVSVPIEPTGQMIAYGAEALKWQDYDSDAESCYRAMINAAEEKQR